ncbi:unnamed protein product [marine sediment metagenome]|uniref:Uncharacterized protein n=1 Tax=marine sediment metagenome TaxID=412755 RepID=X0T878_9ZZZZ
MRIKSTGPDAFKGHFLEARSVTTSCGGSKENNSNSQKALELYRKAQKRIKKGDWAGYGKAVKELGKILEKLGNQRPEKYNRNCNKNRANY